MNRDKQIEEMAKAIEQARIKATDTTNSMNYGFGGWYAKELYAKGYRKASEIFEEIEEEIVAEIDLNNGALIELEDASEIYCRIKGEISALCDIQDFIAELKKKYESEKDNGKV